MEKRYNIIDMDTDVRFSPNGELVFENQTQLDVIGLAYGIMEDRSEALDDELAKEFKEVIKNGVEGISFDCALELLSDWRYEVKLIEE